MKRVIAVIEVDEDRADEEGCGLIDYLEREFCWLTDSGIFLNSIKTLDNDEFYKKGGFC